MKITDSESSEAKQVLRVLDVGAGRDSVAPALLSLTEEHNYELVTIDADDETEPSYVHDITKEFPEELNDSFDLVVCSHVLEHIPRDGVGKTFDNIKKTLVNHGELWVLVPSIEWVAGEILDGRHNIAVEANIYGSQASPYQFHRCSFTLQTLRFLFEQSDLLIKRAFQAPYVVTFNEKEFICLQNIVIGARYDELFAADQV
jgi:predicted SAM-dependent methyltransferase